MKASTQVENGLFFHGVLGPAVKLSSHSEGFRVMSDNMSVIISFSGMVIKGLDFSDCIFSHSD